jgi:N6-L-threonylcarbamoyladenine synthase
MLVPRTMEAIGLLGYDRLVAAGGVAANSRIRADLTAAAQRASKLFTCRPSPSAETTPR